MMWLDSIEIGVLKGNWQEPLLRFLFGMLLSRKMLLEQKSLVAGLSVLFASLLEGPLGFAIFSWTWFFTKKPIDLYSMIGVLLSSIAWVSPIEHYPAVALSSAYFLGFGLIQKRFFVYPLYIGWCSWFSGQESIQKLLILGLLALVTEELLARKKEQGWQSSFVLPFAFHVLLGLFIIAPAFQIEALNLEYGVSFIVPIVLMTFGILNLKGKSFQLKRLKLKSLPAGQVKWVARKVGFWNISDEWVFLVFSFVIAASTLFLWTSIGVQK